MSNGSVVRLHFSEPPSTSVPASPPAPAPEDPIEQKIAEATADIIMTLARSVCDYARIVA